MCRRDKDMEARLKKKTQETESKPAKLEEKVHLEEQFVMRLQKLGKGVLKGQAEYNSF